MSPVSPLRSAPRPRGLTALAWLLALAALPLARPARAQSIGAGDASALAATQGDAPALPTLTAPGAQPAPAPNADQVSFTADRLDYDEKADVVTASGNVRMLHQGDRLRADQVVWNRKTGVVRAIGNVAVQNPQGDVAYGNEVELTDQLKDGLVDDLLLVLENGGRLAAKQASRRNGVYMLVRAAYSPCDVTTSSGCPREPLWKITAARVTYDPQRHRISYRGARLDLLGLTILYLPAFSHPDGTGSGSSGLLVPDATYNGQNGLSVAVPYYRRLAPNRDVTITPHIFTAVLPMLEAQYRELTSTGAFQVHGYATASNQSTTSATAGANQFRGYFEGNGRFQLGPYWTLSGSVRLVTDKTFLRRYDISQDDRLRSVLKAERIDDDSYLSIAGWSFRTLVPGQNQSAQPIALPAIDYRRRIDDPLLGGTVTLQANSLSILRLEGQDTERVFASAEWDKWFLTPMGQVVTLTGLARGDVYHSDQNGLTATTIYQGEPGWQPRAIGAAAVDVRWPFVGPAFGGTQTVTPRIQLVAAGATANLVIPDEDSRAVDLTDTDLFALNRFPGYDRFETGERVTYGVDYGLTLPHFTLSGQIGQSYRFSHSSDILPPGTGLDSRFSDFVGRVAVRYGSFVSLIDRFRLDNSNFAIRVNEADVTLGSAQTYLLAGYLSLNRHISPAIEDLRDRQELRLGGRVAFLKHWSLFGSATIDLTKAVQSAVAQALDPEQLLIVEDGFAPVRDRIGIAYDDDCFEFALTYRRDYTAVGDARTGNTIQVRLAFKNLGR